MPEKNQTNPSNQISSGDRSQGSPIVLNNQSGQQQGARPAQPVHGGRGSNLTGADRRRGGENSASEQTRNNRGQFAGTHASHGTASSNGNRDGSGATLSVKVRES